MPKYIGPFSVVEIEGKPYRPGDPVNLPPERIAQLRHNDNLHFETTEPALALAPSVQQQQGPEQAEPPNEFGVPQPHEQRERKHERKD